MIDELKRSKYYLFDFLKKKLSSRSNETTTSTEPESKQSKIQYKNNEEVQTAA